MSDILVVIPSRLNSKRLHQKPLVNIKGKPLILHAWHNAIKANIGEVIVACCSKKIADIINSAGGKSIITDPNISSGSERVHAAIQSIKNTAKIIINLQGDLASIQPKTIHSSLQPLQNPKTDIGTIAIKISSKIKTTKNIVTIATHINKNGIGRAIYFSRSIIPSGKGNLYKHIGIYAYRKNALNHFVSLPPSYLEKRENLEQIRALEGGLNIGVCLVKEMPIEINTQEDLKNI